MYVIYYQTERFPFRFMIKETNTNHKYWFPFEKSESCMMIPGTIDPND
jgi:hypothetical protein